MTALAMAVAVSLSAAFMAASISSRDTSRCAGVFFCVLDVDVLLDLFPSRVKHFSVNIFARHDIVGLDIRDKVLHLITLDLFPVVSKQDENQLLAKVNCGLGTGRLHKPNDVTNNFRLALIDKDVQGFFPKILEDSFCVARDFLHLPCHFGDALIAEGGTEFIKIGILIAIIFFVPFLYFVFVLVQEVRLYDTTFFTVSLLHSTQVYRDTVTPRDWTAHAYCGHASLSHV